MFHRVGPSHQFHSQTHMMTWTDHEYDLLSSTTRLGTWVEIQARVKGIFVTLQ